MNVNTGVFIEGGIRLVSAAVVLVIGWTAGNWLDNRISTLTKIDQTLAGFLGGLAKYTVFAISIITVLGQFGVQTASLLAVLGAAGLAVGLALQGTLSNVAAGAMLLILRPFKVGDTITAGRISGTVKTLGLFGTELTTADNVYVFAPNSMIWNSDIWNYSRHDIRAQEVVFSVPAGEDTGRIFSIAEQVLDDETRILKMEEKKPQVILLGMNEVAVTITARFWCHTSDSVSVKRDVARAMREAMMTQPLDKRAAA